MAWVYRSPQLNGTRIFTGGVSDSTNTPVGDVGNYPQFGTPLFVGYAPNAGIASGSYWNVPLIGSGGLYTGQTVTVNCIFGAVGTGSTSANVRLAGSLSSVGNFVGSRSIGANNVAQLTGNVTWTGSPTSTLFICLLEGGAGGYRPALISATVTLPEENPQFAALL